MPNPWFRFKQFIVWHDKCAMKVGTDGVLLGAWASVKKEWKVLDVGTGTGLIALMLAQRGAKDIDAIDIDYQAFCQAEANISASCFSGVIHSYHSSLSDHVRQCNKEYDLIISNPPYFTRSLKGPDAQRNIARHNDNLPLEELIKDSLEVLSGLGRIALILPVLQEERLYEILNRSNLYPLRKTYVKTTPTAIPKRFLIELSKQKEGYEENTLVIEEKRHVYSPEFKKLTEDFYL